MERRKPLKRSPMPKPRVGFWTCQRTKTIDGVKIKCSWMNTNRKQKCESCGGAKPKRNSTKKKHMAVLDVMSYEDFIELTGEEACGICGAPPKAKRLHRDHDHNTGKARGLLCFRCNAALRSYMTEDWLMRAAHYLRRAKLHERD